VFARYDSVAIAHVMADGCYVSCVHCHCSLDVFCVFAGCPAGVPVHARLLPVRLCA